jgi:hypothetical protein
MHEMMHNMMANSPGMMSHAGMMWAMGLVGLLVVFNLGLSAAALAKYLFFRNSCREKRL